MNFSPLKKNYFSVFLSNSNIIVLIFYRNKMFYLDVLNIGTFI